MTTRLFNIFELPTFPTYFLSLPELYRRACLHAYSFRIISSDNLLIRNTCNVCYKFSILFSWMFSRKFFSVVSLLFSLSLSLFFHFIVKFFFLVTLKKKRKKKNRTVWSFFRVRATFLKRCWFTSANGGTSSVKIRFHILRFLNSKFFPCIWLHMREELWRKVRNLLYKIWKQSTTYEKWSYKFTWNNGVVRIRERK